jgi:hypothetical protein
MTTLKRSPLNRTQLQHISLGIKIYKVMKAAIKSGLPQYVTNRNGDAIIRINYSRNTANAFTFWCGKSQANITDCVLSVLREVV